MSLGEVVQLLLRSFVWIHRMVWVEGDLEDDLVPLP